MNEIIKAIDKMKVGKAPGPDGPLPEFYKMFKMEGVTKKWESIKSFMDGTSGCHENDITQIYFS